MLTKKQVYDMINDDNLKYGTAFQVIEVSNFIEKTIQASLL
jgi:hypothetical protein